MSSHPWPLPVYLHYSYDTYKLVTIYGGGKTIARSLRLPQR